MWSKAVAAVVRTIVVLIFERLGSVIALVVSFRRMPAITCAKEAISEASFGNRPKGDRTVQGLTSYCTG